MLGYKPTDVVEIYPSKIRSQEARGSVISRKNVINPKMLQDMNNYSNYLLYPGVNSPAVDSLLKLKIWNPVTKKNMKFNFSSYK